MHARTRQSHLTCLDEVFLALTDRPATAEVHEEAAA